MKKRQPPNHNAPRKATWRIRAVYARREALRYISHLEMQQVWERTLRRAGIALAYSQAFNPRPRLHMAAALPLGFLSRCEMVDFWVEMPDAETQLDVDALAAAIQAAAPPSLIVQRVERAAPELPPLQTQVESAEYSAEPYDPIEPDALAQSVSALLAAGSLPRERRGKDYDLRPLIEMLEIEEGSPPRLVMRLAAREGATGRPEEVLDALGLDPTAFRVERTALILKPAPADRGPIPVD